MRQSPPRPSGCRILVASLAALVAPLAPQAAAQEWPTKPVRMIVPFPPGGGTDVIGRVLAQRLGEGWGQQVVIENRPGAAGLIGADQVAKSAPDGYTQLMTALGGITMETLPQFAPVVLVAAPPSVLVVHPDVKATTVAQLVALARAAPGKVSFGTSGAGSLSHLAAELLKSMGKVDMLHVPYKGIGQVVTELLGGHVQFAVAPLPAVQAQVKGGKLRALAVTGTKRFPPLPDLPAVGETPGFAGFEAINWFGLLAPAKVPRALVDRLNADVNRVLAQAEVREKLAAIGADPVGGTVEEFARYIRTDTEKWERLAREAGVSLK